MKKLRYGNTNTFYIDGNNGGLLVDTDYAGVCCVVLTGMGMDGTEGIKNLVKGKKLHIISQDEATCAVYGMPKAIAQTGLVNAVLPLDKIAAAITKEIGTR